MTNEDDTLDSLAETREYLFNGVANMASPPSWVAQAIKAIDDALALLDAPTRQS